MQTIVDSVIYRIDKKQVNELYIATPKVETVFEDLNAILLNKSLKRDIDLIKYSPEQYYLQTMEEYGTTLDYVPSKDIASYLDITPQALSRIRKRIFQLRLSASNIQVMSSAALNCNYKYNQKN